jgi:hypothetical protein
LIVFVGRHGRELFHLATQRSRGGGTSLTDPGLNTGESLFDRPKPIHAALHT